MSVKGGRNKEEETGWSGGIQVAVPSESTEYYRPIKEKA